MKEEHKKILMTHIRQVGINIVNDKPIPGIMEDLKGILISLKKLNDYYGN